MPIVFEPPETPPKIVVVGAGAMGSIYAGFFAEAGYRVSVVDVWAEHISAITKAGLRLEGSRLRQGQFPATSGGERVDGPPRRAQRAPLAGRRVKCLGTL